MDRRGGVRLVEGRVPLVEPGALDRLTAHPCAGIAQEGFLGRRVVGGVDREAVHAVQAVVGAPDDVGVELRGLAQVVVPAQPSGVREVHVGVDVRNGVQLVQRVLHRLDLDAAGLGLGALGIVEVGDQVGQSVGLDDRGDADVVVLRVVEDTGDGIDVVGLVPL